MVNKMMALIKKHQSELIYLVFGVLTTLVDWAVFWLCRNFAGMPAWLSNTVSWVIAVLFAYLTNKPFVFHSQDWSVGNIIPEFIRFVGTRVASFLVQTAIMFGAVDVLGWNGNVWKILTSVLVIFANYFGSKLLVFRNK